MDPRFIPKDDDTDGKYAHLAEECAEMIVEAAAIIKEVQKGVRFGLDTSSPPESNDPNTTPKGRLRLAVRRLQCEIGDVNFAIARLGRELEL